MQAYNLLLEPQVITTAADVGPIVRARRRDQALRIDDAAALTGVSVDLFSRLENGKGAVRLDKLLLVLDGLGLTLVMGPKDHPGIQTLTGPTDPRLEQP
jgi:transcriptional regulator with XRE-family HTH domain